jgi:putative ABC transport system substrate-binding protein
VEAAARLMKLQVHIFKATTSREIDAVFASFERERPDALFLGQDALFTSRRLQLVNLSARHAIPLTAGSRDIAEVGGLMSYGSNILDAYRHVGVYAGRILRGENPAEMPVEQSTKLELVINLQTARMLGIDVPARLLAIADEVIE